MTHAPKAKPPADAASGDAAALRAELERLRSQWHDYAASVSHDVRAPVRHILAFVQILREEWDSADADTLRGYLDRLDQSAQLLVRQMEALTTLSRLARQTPQWQSVDVHTLVHELVAENRTRHTGPGLQWRLPDALPAVRADVVMLREALWQLLDNAVKFSAGVAAPCVQISAVLQPGGDWALEVVDNGVGFDARHAGQLGRPFQRLHSQQEFAGLGMGLALARTAVEGLGGGLEVLGEPGRGCRARITLRGP